MRPPIRGSTGSTLIEALIAILLFSFAVLGLISMQAVAIRETTDAKYRADAAFLANQIIARMWVDRAGAFEDYKHMTGGTTCSFSGTAATSANVQPWIDRASALLPGVSSGSLQISVTNPGSAGYSGIAVRDDTRTVAVTVCWQPPQSSGPHNFTAQAQISL